MRHLLTMTFGIVIALGVIGCTKEDPAPTPPPVKPAPTVDPDAEAAAAEAAAAKHRAEQEAADKKAAEDAAKQATEEADKAAGEAKAEAVVEAEEKVSWFGRQLATLKEKSAAVGDKAGAGWKAAVTKAETSYDTAKSKLTKLKAAGNDAWTEAKPELETALEELKEAYDKASTAFKSKLAEDTLPTGEPVPETEIEK